MINWKARFKSPMWWLGMISVALSPILTYFGLAYADLTTWDSIKNLFFDFISNPYLIGVVVVTVIGALGVNTDPLTKGLKDTSLGMSYDEPRDESEEEE